MSKLEVARLSNEEIEDLFGASYEEQIASRNGIDPFECKCVRENTDSSDIRMEVVISGFAGTPTLDDYKDGKVAHSDAVLIQKEDRGSLKLVLNPQEIISLNTNDYLVVYQPE